MSDKFDMYFVCLFKSDEVFYGTEKECHEFIKFIKDDIHCIFSEEVLRDHILDHTLIDKLIKDYKEDI